MFSCPCSNASRDCSQFSQFGLRASRDDTLAVRVNSITNSHNGRRRCGAMFRRTIPSFSSRLWIDIYVDNTQKQNRRYKTEHSHTCCEICVGLSKSCWTGQFTIRTDWKCDNWWMTTWITGYKLTNPIQWSMPERWENRYIHPKIINLKWINSEGISFCGFFSP